MTTNQIGSKRVFIVSLAVLVVGIAMLAVGGTAFAANVTNSSAATVSIPSGGWVAYTFDFPGPGNDVGVTMSYDALPGIGNLDKFITLDAYQPSDGYRDSIGSASVMSPDVQLYQLSSKALTHSELKKIEDNLDASQAPAGKYMVIVHNWTPDGRAVTVHLSTEYISKIVDNQDNLANPRSHLNTGYFVISPNPGPALTELSSGS